MRTREYLESYVYSTTSELKELSSINWPQNLGRLEDRISSLENFIHEAVIELKFAK
jgi:hypothetical protein